MGLNAIKDIMYTSYMEIQNEDNPMRYHCECCNYHCMYLSHWNQHCESERHKNNGIRKIRSDKRLNPQCKDCSYNSTNSTNMKVHCLNQHSPKEERKKEFKYYCERCDFGTFVEILFTRHTETKKHINLYSVI
jgi:hypothetical protein